MLRLLVASIILILAAVAIFVGLVNKPLERPLLIEPHSSGAWPEYASAASEAVTHEPDIVCVHVLTRRAMRRGPKPIVRA